MFAMLNGRLPRPADTDADPDAAVAAAVELQVRAGLDLVTDGGARWPDASTGLRAVLAALADGDTGTHGLLVRAWRSTAEAAAGRATAAAVVPGPVTLAAESGSASRAAGPGGPATSPAAIGAALHGELVALAEAGCPLVVIEEPAAISIGADEAARASFRDAHRALLGDGAPPHAMLAISGGSAWEAGSETIGAAPYASFLLDLIAGPDNWYLARALPGSSGIVCAALRAPSAVDQAPELVWAANYAASMSGRSLDRVGLANASPLDGLTPADAEAALAAVARAARFASMSPEEAVAAGLDRRTFAQPAGRGARRMGL